MHQNQEENFNTILSNHATTQCGTLSITGVNDTLSAYITSRLYQLSNRSILVVTATSDDARRYIKELVFFVGNNNSKHVVYFPSYNVSPLERIPYHNGISSRRIACLYNLLENNSNLIVVTDLCGLRQKLIPKKILIRYVDLIEIEEEIDLLELVEKLISGGYKRTVVVEEPGDFSVRGGIIDFFPPMYNEPVRIELFGDFVESIRFFSPINQRTLRSVDQIVVLPVCETIFEKDRLNSIIGNIKAVAVRQGLSFEHVRQIVKNISIDGTFPNIDKLAPVIYGHMDSLFDYLQESSIVVTVDRSKLASNAIFLELEEAASFTNVLKSGQLCVAPKDLFLNYLSVERKILSKNSVDLSLSRVVRNNGFIPENYFDVNCLYNDDTILAMEKSRNSDEPFLPLFDFLSKNRINGYLTVLVCNSENKIKRINSILSLNKVNSITVSGFPSNSRLDFHVYVCLGLVRSGFILPWASIAVLTYEEIFGKKSRRRNFNSVKTRESSFDLEDLKAGEFVVHYEHGVGQYEGLIRLNVDRVASEFLLIKYRNEDKLYLPVDRMELVQRYMGIEKDCAPLLDKIGGKSWGRSKRKACRSAEKIAGSLLEVYAKRKVQIGHAFLCDDKSLLDFESQFMHEETPDQLKAIRDVLDDMRKPIPMDRLVCGDVGYGKTEIAMRASFVAINSAKQVAILVPTTVLAEQHFSTFSTRFKKYSVKIACLSRFKSKSEQKHIIRDIKTGLIDIVVGTHRLLQDDVFFLELGLVILDEEQRFGVKHKERLKKIRTSVDVLTLTATPIPRTLHLSLMGVRDISVISTPPDQRCSIITYVCEFDNAVVAAAISSELDRKGQIFFIHNNINTIEMVARKLRILTPGIRLGIAHGKMKEEKLEDIMMAFVDGEIDMLVCTTIIESGINIVRANTIMINRADRFGLAQIYQIRGRVGRSDEQAYAYLFVPDGRVLGDKASKRLKVLMEHSDLGSGFQIAMNDMKIRGGGTILGASQSGHIASVGYDMFLRLMEESVVRLKGNKGNSLESFLETEINIPVSAFISESYIPDIDQRLSMYRRLTKMKQLENLSSLKEEFIDRFGQMPEETENLFLKIILKILGFCAGVQKIDISDQRFTLLFSEKHRHKSSEISAAISGLCGFHRITSDGIFVVDITDGTLMASMLQVKNVLIEITHRVSGSKLLGS